VVLIEPVEGGQYGADLQSDILREPIVDVRLLDEGIVAFTTVLEFELTKVVDLIVRPTRNGKCQIMNVKVLRLLGRTKVFRAMSWDKVSF
jgi:hypothetical protein